jgi:thiosulfate/3-mercaptopyruvate sulfurtransferase
MKKVVPIALILLAAILVTIATGIGPGPALADSDLYIIEAEEAARLLGGENVVLVDMQEAENYALGHIEGSVNIVRNDVVVNTPYPTMIAPAKQIAEVLGSAGIDNDTLVIIYDDSGNINAARLWWTMLVYGHQNVKVVSGGFSALQKAGLALSTDAPAVQAKTYEPGEADESLIATLDEVVAQVENPQPGVILLDTRAYDEYSAGTIPGAVLVNYEENNFSDGTFRPVQHILIHYKEKGITADNEIIVFCAVSVRGAQTFLALYNAGYRNLKLYDGAWAEYSAIYAPEGGETGSPQPEEDEPAAPGG